MLRQISEPLALSEASILALRPALNAPVLNVEFLPVGPARAAIVIFAEEYGGIGLAFGIRSTEGGQVAVFKNREPIDEAVPLNDLLEPALASAERMGFLFDEDMVVEQPGSTGRTEATALWGRLMGDIAMPPAPKAAPPLPAATEPILDLTESIQAEPEVPELSLEEVAPEIELELPAPPGEPPVAVVPSTGLSKFRGTASPPLPPGAPDSPAEVDGDRTEKDNPSQLGRVPLKRVRRDGEGSKRIPYLARLLSSFLVVRSND